VGPIGSRVPIRPKPTPAFHPGSPLADTGAVGPILIFAAGVVAIGGIAYHKYVRTRERREALFGFAATHGFEYSRNDPFGLTDYPFRLFSLGDGRGCENVLWGAWHGMPVTEADYWYYEESTDSEGHTSRSYHRFSVVLADLEIGAPAISIQREGVFSRLADHLGFHDIEFESEEFNRLFQIKAPDREFAYQLIDARMMQWLIGLDSGETYELAGNRLLVARKPVQPPELPALFDRAMEFTDHVPRPVWNEYGTGEPAGQEERSTL
jgi:hypothetical protein